MGSSIWVAKSNDYDWNVYRTNLIPGRITNATDNLNGTVTLTFSDNHNLRVADNIIVKYFDENVDGSYSVVSVPSLKKVNIVLGFPQTTSSITGDGVCYILESVRVQQASDISTLSFANNLLSGNQVWVDNDGTDHWAFRMHSSL